MDGMTSHRKGWTVPQLLLATACTTLGIAVAVLGFIDIYLTVTHLLQAWWHGWSWTVIVLGEGSFAGCYAGLLLLQLRDRPPRQVRAFLAAYLTLFAAGSLALNVYAARGSFPDVASHVIVVAAFFGYLLFAKVLVKRLSADPAARAAEEALTDARQHAIDLIRSELGIAWRLRCPSLLRRQVLKGRLPDRVKDDVRLKVSAGRSSGWEATVSEWVIDALTRSVKTAVRVREEKRVIEASAAAPAPPQNDAVPDRPATRPKPASSRAAKTAKARRLLMDRPELTREEIGRQAGVSLSTVDRIKRDLPTPLRRRAEA